MKSLIALLSLVLIAGCAGNSGGGGNTPPNKSNGAPTTGGAGKATVAESLVTKAWCNTYSQGTEVQDRFTFSRDGIVSYKQFVLEGGERTVIKIDQQGTWGTDGSRSQVAVGTYVFELSYTANDPATRGERVNLKIDGQWIPFDICD